MAKILIIGAKGMLGQYLAREFFDDELILVDREEFDITSRDGVPLQIKNLKPDLIINAAAYNDVDGAEKNPEIVKLINGYSVGFLAKAAKEVGATFIHYSSDYVFDGEKEEGYREDDQPKPISVYGESKYLGEVELQENCEKYYLIRLSRLFGRVGAGEGVKKSFIDKMLELAETRDSLEVINEEVSCPTYAKDLAELTKYIWQDKKPYGIYHGVNSGSCTWYELAQEIFKIKGLGVNLQAVNGDKFSRAAKRPKYSFLLNTKLSPQRSWQEALKEYLNEEKTI